MVDLKGLQIDLISRLRPFLVLFLFVIAFLIFTSISVVIWANQFIPHFFLTVISHFFLRLLRGTLWRRRFARQIDLQWPKLPEIATKPASWSIDIWIWQRKLIKYIICFLRGRRLAFNKNVLRLIIRRQDIIFSCLNNQRLWLPRYCSFQAPACFKYRLQLFLFWFFHSCFLFVFCCLHFKTNTQIYYELQCKQKY